MILSGSCTMPAMPAHRDTILDLISRQEPLRIDLSGVTAADVSLVQLLIAAKQSSQVRSLPFAITAASDVVCAAFAAAGVPSLAMAAPCNEA